jgi:hypothetical protein
MLLDVSIYKQEPIGLIRKSSTNHLPQGLNGNILQPEGLIREMLTSNNMSPAEVSI